MQILKIRVNSVNKEDKIVAKMHMQEASQSMYFLHGSQVMQNLSHCNRKAPAVVSLSTLCSFQRVIDFGTVVITLFLYDLWELRHFNDIKRNQIQTLNDDHWIPKVCFRQFLTQIDRGVVPDYNSIFRYCYTPYQW